MPKVVVCTKCSIKFGIPDNAAGHLIQCPGCRMVFSLPPTGAPSPPALQSAPPFPQAPPSRPVVPTAAPAPAAPLPQIVPPLAKPPQAMPRQTTPPQPAPPLPSRSAPAQPSTRWGRDDERGAPAHPAERSSGLVWFLVAFILLAMLGGGWFLAYRFYQRTLIEEEQAARDSLVALEKAKAAAVAQQANQNTAPPAPVLPKEAPPPQPKPAADKAAPPRPEVPKTETPKLEASKAQPPNVEVPNKVEPKPEQAPPKVAKLENSKKEEAKKDAPVQDEIRGAADGWHAVQSVQGRFHVALPATPVLHPLKESGAEGLEYRARHPRLDLVFSATAVQQQLTQLPEAAAQADYDAALARPFGKAEFGVKDSDITHEGRKGKEFVAGSLDNKKAVGWYFRLEDVPGATRTFCFTVSGSGARLDAPEVQRFLSSVKIDKGDILLAKKDSAPKKPAQGATFDPFAKPEAPGVAKATAKQAAPAPTFDPFTKKPGEPAKLEEGVAQALARLKSKKTEDRVQALDELGRRKEEAGPALRAICDSLANDAVKAVRIAALSALEKVHPDVYKRVVVLLVEDNPRRHEAAVREIAGLGDDARGAFPVLLGHLKTVPTRFNSDVPVLMSALLESLAKIAADEAAVQKAFLDMTRFGDRSEQGLPVREAAVAALETLVREQRDQVKYVTPGLVTASRQMLDDRIRERAIGILGTIAENHTELRSQVAAGLLALVKLGDFNAIGALGKCGRAAKDAIPFLKQLKLNPNESVREAAASALAQIESTQGSWAPTAPSQRWALNRRA